MPSFHHIRENDVRATSASAEFRYIVDRLRDRLFQCQSLLALDTVSPIVLAALGIHSTCQTARCLTCVLTLWDYVWTGGLG